MLHFMDELRDLLEDAGTDQLQSPTKIVTRMPFPKFQC